MSGAASSLAVQTDVAAMKFNHLGIPTNESFDGEMPLPQLKVRSTIISTNRRP